MQVGASYMRKSESTHFLPFSLVALYTTTEFVMNPYTKPLSNHIPHKSSYIRDSEKMLYMQPQLNESHNSHYCIQ